MYKCTSGTVLIRQGGVNKFFKIDRGHSGAHCAVPLIDFNNRA